MVDHGLGKNARTLALTSASPSFRSSGWQETEKALLSSWGADPYASKRAQDLRGRNEDGLQKRLLTYVPEMGRYKFWYGWHRMTFERISAYAEEYDNNGRRVFRQAVAGCESVVISCTSPFSGAKPIQDFLRHIQTTATADRMTTIYRPDIANFSWDQGITRPSRFLNAVTLDENVKDDLVKDIQTYLSPATRKYYANRGIPYRRGYLFYGTPGCGKTSFSNALAGHFGLNIYVFSLSSMDLTDDFLEMLFEQLPSRCIVLLEDIDSSGLRRETMRVESPNRTKKWKTKQIVVDEDGNPTSEATVDGDGNAVRVVGVTLSGLLNVLDGIHSKEGVITIMTSNSPDNLDPALVRPGRIDRKILFGYCSTQVMEKLFRHIFERAPEEIAEGETNDARDYDIASLAETFALKVPANKLSPAEVQGYLLMHRGDPVAAVDQAADWAIRTVERKVAGVNVDSFETEIEDGRNGGDPWDIADSMPSGGELSSSSSFTDGTSLSSQPPAESASACHLAVTGAGPRVGAPVPPPQSITTTPMSPDVLLARVFSNSLMEKLDIFTPPMSRTSSQKAWTPVERLLSMSHSEVKIHEKVAELKERMMRP